MHKLVAATWHEDEAQKFCGSTSSSANINEGHTIPDAPGRYDKHIVKKHVNLPIAIPSKMAWMESAKTMTKLLIADKILFSLALVSTMGLLLFSGEVSCCQTLILCKYFRPSSRMSFLRTILYYNILTTSCHRFLLTRVIFRKKARYALFFEDFTLQQFFDFWLIGFQF
jgi:hypothetical protein